MACYLQREAVAALSVTDVQTVTPLRDGYVGPLTRPGGAYPG